MLFGVHHCSWTHGFFFAIVNGNHIKNKQTHENLGFDDHCYLWLLCHRCSAGTHKKLTAWSRLAMETYGEHSSITALCRKFPCATTCLHCFCELYFRRFSGATSLSAGFMTMSRLEQFDVGLSENTFQSHVDCWGLAKTNCHQANRMPMALVD